MPEVQSRTYANPRRLPRRNHYQEGPGFLFVATQGGRPPDADRQRARAAIVRRRRAALRRWADGEPLATIRTELRCSRASLFRWRTRFEQGGLEALLDGPRVGRRSDLPPALERLILTVRLLTYWNSRRIAAEFRRRAVWPLSHGQVDRLLTRQGSHRPSYVRTPGPRYERAAPNELWHIDLKGPFYLLGATGRGRTCHFVALVDDHSRFLLGIRAVPTKEAVWVLALLEEAIELCGVPHELMTDNGTPFVAILRSMLSRFQRTLAELSIRHIRTQIDTPWTNGKDVHLCQAASSARSGLNSVPAGTFGPFAELVRDARNGARSTAPMRVREEARPGAFELLEGRSLSHASGKTD